MFGVLLFPGLFPFLGVWVAVTKVEARREEVYHLGLLSLGRGRTTDTLTTVSDRVQQSRKDISGSSLASFYLLPVSFLSTLLFILVVSLFLFVQFRPRPEIIDLRLPLST